MGCRGVLPHRVVPLEKRAESCVEAVTARGAREKGTPLLPGGLAQASESKSITEVIAGERGLMQLVEARSLLMRAWW